jgi:hypothetical protein
MLASGKQEIIVNGQRLQAQLESQLDQRDSGDMLLGTVLSSYPDNAYIVNAGQTEFKIDRQRKPYVEIPYNIVMSKFWVEAMDEALGLVAVDSSKCNTLSMSVADAVTTGRTAGTGVRKLAGSVCGNSPDIRVFYKPAGNFFPVSNGYYFADDQTLSLINAELQTPIGQQHIGLRVDMLAADGSIIDSRCAKINNELFVDYALPAGAYNLNKKRQLLRPNILGQNNVYGVLRLHINSVEQMDELVKIKLNVQKTCN